MFACVEDVPSQEAWLTTRLQSQEAQGESAIPLYLEWLPGFPEGFYLSYTERLSKHDFIPGKRWRDQRRNWTTKSGG